MYVQSTATVTSWLVSSDDVHRKLYVELRKHAWTPMTQPSTTTALRLAGER